MNLYLRFIWLLLSGIWKQPAELLDETELSFRVLPNDLDINLHMNNGRYATIMDLGRFDYMQRTGLFKQVRENKWMPIVAQVDLTFLRPLKLFNLYTMKTKPVHWDAHWLYIEQTFFANDKLMAKAFVIAQFRKGRERVEVRDILDSVEYDGETPTVPEAYKDRLNS